MRPKLTRANVAEIRELHSKWPRKYTSGALREEFGVSYPTILAVLAGEYKPLEDYLEAQNVICTSCGASVHPSIAVYDNHSHEHSPKPWHCKACWTVCQQPTVIIPTPPPVEALKPKRVRRPRVYAYVTNENVRRIRAVAPGSEIGNVQISKHGDYSRWCHGKRATLAMTDLSGAENAYRRRCALAVCELFDWNRKEAQ